MSIGTTNDGNGLRVLVRWLGETRRDWDTEPIDTEPARGDSVMPNTTRAIAIENLRSLGQATPNEAQIRAEVNRINRDNDRERRPVIGSRRAP